MKLYVLFRILRNSIERSRQCTRDVNKDEDGARRASTDNIRGSHRDME